MLGTGSGSDWTDATIAALRSLWDEGLPTAEIGRRLGVSKNAVVGKSHRLNLPARPSPIRRDGVRQAPRPRRPRCPSLSELQQTARPQTRPIVPPPPPPRPRTEQTPPCPLPWSPTRIPPAVTTRAATPGQHACCWPIGEPGRPGFRFCEGESAAGKPYCEAHCTLAYQRKRERNEAA